MRRSHWALAALLGLLVLLVPLGLLAPGSAEFEWAPEELAGLAGYVPAGLERLNALWALAPLAGYAVPGAGEEAGFLAQAAGYILSAAVGVGLIFAVIAAVRLTVGRRTARHAPGPRGG